MPRRKKGKNNEKTSEDNNKKENVTDDENCSLPVRATIKKMKVADYLKTTLRPSSTFVAENGTRKIGNTIFLSNGRLLIPKERILIGKFILKNFKYFPSYQWSTLLPQQENMRPKEMAPYLSGTIGAAREIETELAAFHIYVTEKMLETILTHTNDEILISQYYIFPKPSCVYPITITELKALIGILYLSAVKKDSKISTTFLWGVCGSDIYNAVMSKERFEYLINCLRFDEYSTREMRLKSDSFSAIREFWKQFTKKCAEMYRPSINCTIDEIFVNFNGNSKLKLPLTDKKNDNLKIDEKGLKLVLLCDTNHRYIISGIPYIKRNTTGAVLCDNAAKETEDMIQKLTRPIHGTNINITYGTDTFNSIPLAKKMLHVHKLPTIGALHKNHVEIPPDLIQTENRLVGTSTFVYNVEDQLQLCTHYSNKGEVDVLLSSINFGSVIKEPEGKPEIVEYYESTKSGVDIINRMCYGYSCLRQARHWFVAIFFSILDFAGINSLTILNLNRAKCGKPPIRRVDFLYKLALDLMLPYMKERLTDPDIKNLLKDKIRNIIEERQHLDTDRNPQKHTGRYTKETYSYCRVVKPKQQVTPTLNTKTQRNSEKLPNMQIQNECPIKVCDLPIGLPESNKESVPEEVTDLYPPSACLLQALCPPAQPSIIWIQPVIPLNLGWFAPNFILQQIQGLDVPLQFIIPVHQVTPVLYSDWGLSILTRQYIQALYSSNLLQQSVSQFSNSRNIPLNLKTQQTQPTYPTKSTFNTQQNSPKLIDQQPQDINIYNQSLIPKVSNTLNSEKNLTKTTDKQSQAMIPSSQTVTPNITSTCALDTIEPNLPTAFYWNRQENLQALTLQQIQTLCPSSQPVKPMLPSIVSLRTEHSLPILPFHQIQVRDRRNVIINTFQPPPQLQPETFYRINQLVKQNMPNTQQNLNRLTVQHSQEYFFSQSINANLSSICNLNLPTLPFQPKQDMCSSSSLIKSIYAGVSNAQQNSPTLAVQQIQNSQSTKTVDCVTLVMNTQQDSANSTSQSKHQAGLPNQAESKVPRKIVSEFKKELSVCGVCNGFGNKIFFVECFKCAVMLCSVHSKIHCTDCVNLDRSGASAIYSYVTGSKKGKCGICKPQGLIHFSVQCCKCSKFICLDHRRTVCCFCTEI